MKTFVGALLVSALSGVAPCLAQETIDTRIGKLTFESGYPSKETVQKLYDEMDFQRAAQAYIWGIPAVGLAEWRLAHRDVFKAKNGEMLSYLDFAEKLGILTPNYTTPYIVTLVDLQESGPFVIELPPGLMAGMILDAWQRVLADLGVVGPDKGNGGKFLILPPGHEMVQLQGYYVVQSPGRTVFAGIRLLDADKEKAIQELIPGIKTYKWSPSGTGEVMGVRHAGDVKWSQMPPRGMAYWESLNKVVQSEPVMERDRLILAQLRFLGIEKGKPFAPDARQRMILEEAAVVGEAMAKANTTDKRVEPPFWPGTNWKHALVVSVDQRMPGYDQLDERAAWFYEAVAVSKGMLTQTPGVGQRYIAAYKDRDGNWLTGGKTYRLHIPPDPPAKQFWSVTAYDEGTRQMVVTEQGRPDLSSRKEDLVRNSDGSVDVYFGPHAPKGKEANWVQTAPGKGWFTYFRFYGPTEAFFDKSWALPDFEKIDDGQSSRFDALANLPFKQNRPTPETAKALTEELGFQQATQAYLWALPLINTLGMKFGSEKVFGAGYNVLPVWKERLDTKTLVTTPNSDVIYAMSYVDMGETGPIVFEAPPNLQGILLDFWQRPIPVDGGKFFGDVGLPGPDAGKGGKFLVLPPGYRGDVPRGYYVYRSGTNNLFIFLRAFYQDPKDLSPAVALMEQAKIYPLNIPEAERKPMKFPNASGVAANMLPRSDATAFDQLKWLVDREGQNLASADGLGLLANVGLVAGRPFEPDARSRAILDAAAKTAYKTSRVIGSKSEIGGRNLAVWKDRRWVNPINNISEPGPDKTIDLTFRNKKAGFTDIEARAWMFTDYYSLSPGMVSLTPGRGAFYAVSFKDAEGEPLSGDVSYKLTLPPKVPAELFWSLTLYEAENASGLATGVRRFPSLGSRDKPVQNRDGTTDLYVGPQAPDGKQANWLPTAPGRGFFAILRLYGPGERAIDYSWKPGDIERIGSVSRALQ